MAFLENIKQKNQFPIIFIGSGITKRYFKNAPDWQTLLLSIWKEVDTQDNFYKENYKLRKDYGDDTFKINVELAEVLSKNYNDAFSLCNDILLINPNNIEAMFKAGYCCYRLKKYDISMMHFIKVSSLEKFSTNKAIYKYYMGRCYDIFNSLEDSLECFKGAYKLDKSNHYYTLWLGITYAKIGANDYNYNLALLYLYKAFGIEDSLLYKYAGYCHMQLKSYDKAIEFLEKSIFLKEDDYLTRYYLGHTYFSVQIYDKALEHLSLRQ